MRYDSTYSALVALNKKMGGVQSPPISEYDAVANLMSTMSGGEVDVSTIFPSAGSWFRIKTLKFTADQNYIINNGDIIIKQGTVFGGKFNDSPCAVAKKLKTKP